ncbi:transcriptional regulator TbsP [Haladaptatus sp. NG-SE-30]
MSTVDLLDREMGDIFEELFEETSEPVLFVNPSDSQLEAAIITASEFEGDLPELRIIGSPEIFKTMVEDFLIASEAADLLHQEMLSMRTADEVHRSSMVVLADRLVTLVQFDDRIDGLLSDDADLVDTARQSLMGAWEEGDEFTVRAPPISRVRETLRDEIDPAVEEDFTMVLNSLDEIRGAGGLDEVAISLLVAARNNILLYDISKWGEDVGLASKATFSRTKTRLEDLGILDTEKVPIDVGRPRLRLKLADESMADMPADEMIDQLEGEIRA